MKRKDPILSHLSAFSFTYKPLRVSGLKWRRVMPVNWTIDLATGSEEIDNQHKELFLRMNRFLEACRDERGIAEAGNMLKFLDDYVVFHFSEEERAMTVQNYPDLDLHRSEHVQFARHLVELKEDLSRQKHGIGLILKVNRLVFDWMTNHIRVSDKALGSFLKSKACAS